MSLVSLIEAEGIHYGREDSFKMSAGSLQARRFLLGVPTQQIAPDRILHWCESLGMPERLKTAFAEHFAEANMVGIGSQASCDTGSYKIHLVFWEKVRQHVRHTKKIDPLLLHIGLK